MRAFLARRFIAPGRFSQPHRGELIGNCQGFQEIPTTSVWFCLQVASSSLSSGTRTSCPTSRRLSTVRTPPRLDRVLAGPSFCSRRQAALLALTVITSLLRLLDHPPSCLPVAVADSPQHVTRWSLGRLVAWSLDRSQLPVRLANIRLPRLELARITSDCV